MCETGCAVSTQLAIGGAFALADSSCDRVASLCTVGFWEGASLLDAAERATRPTGGAALLTWDAALPPLHEVALVDALRDVAGIHSEFLARCLAGPDPVQSARWEPVTLHDVVRFDGIAHYWAAMVVERPVAAELRARIRRGAPRGAHRVSARAGGRAPPRTGRCAFRFARRFGASAPEARG